MLNLNRATVIGHLTRDPELRTTPAGHSVVNFAVATNRRWTSREGEQQEETEFHDIVVWGKLAEIATQVLAKGRLAYVEGRLQTRSWEAQDGTPRQRTEIVADNLISLERRREGIDQTPAKEDFDQRPRAEKPQAKKQGKKPAQKIEEAETVNIDDIPL